MSLSDHIAKGTIITSLAQESRKQKVKEALLVLAKQVKEAPEIEPIVEQHLEKIIEAASIMPVAGALAKEILIGLANSIGSETKKTEESK